jgi:hypothetical protein
MEIAREVKPALDLIGRGFGPAAPAVAAPPAGSPIQGDQIAKIAGHAGEQNGAVYKITVGRSDFTMTEMGAVINARMGLKFVGGVHRHRGEGRRRGRHRDAAG